jgi:HPt (histidine-containing phosphotransfer) domain-containing protein
MMKSGQTLDAQASQASVLNKALLDQYKARKSNLLERLINAYLDEAPKFFQNIRTAAGSSDFDGVRMNAHALKSCSYNLGAVRLSKICQEMETAAFEKNAAQIQDSMSRIGPECFEAEQALRTELYQIKHPAGAVQAQPVAAKTEAEWN